MDKRIKQGSPQRSTAPPLQLLLFTSHFSMSQATNVPFFLLDLEEDEPQQQRVRALFTVPNKDTAKRLSHYPILCRSSCFDLQLVDDDEGGSHVFLAATFSSPTPEETAQAIAQKLATRMETMATAFSMTDVLKIV